MDGTVTHAALGGAGRRSAHVRVGAVATAAFLVLLVILATRGPAAADPSVPATAPAATPTVQPQQTTPADPDPGFGRPRGGFRRRGGGGVPGFGRGGGAVPAPDDGGGGLAPAPGTGGGTTT
jgi:hypothetical protein